MEHRTGIEPARSAWEAEVLPLNYRCSKNIIATKHYYYKIEI